MDPAAIVGLCALLAHGVAQAPPAGVTCPPGAITAGSASPERLAASVTSPASRDAIARVTYAEAGNQGDSGLAAVVYTILNRLEDGRWGASVDEVLNARGQFEPVMRAGGDWRHLAPVTPAQQARVDTILNLALDGRLPDLTNGARYFQNPTIVAARARAGEVSPGLVNFGGTAPSAVIGAHAFYAAAGNRGASARAAASGAPARPRAADEAIFVGENRAVTPTSAATPGAPEAPGADDASRGMFVSRDGAVGSDVP
jgi:spore germination cell wall hydrolase CwlJ-like protein